MKVYSVVFAVNIAEAVSQDFSMGFLPNTLNGIAGVQNIITLFYGWKQMVPRNTTLMLAVAILSITLNVIFFGVFVNKVRKK